MKLIERNIQEAIEKANILIEALPYIQSFHEKVVVVKFGGSAMESAEALRGFLQDVVFLEIVGIHPVVVHGGGPAISAAMDARGKEPVFVRGHRMTDKETLEIATDVLVNQLNASMVKTINELGGLAEGVYHWQKRRSVVRSKKKIMKAEDGGEIDLGFVGEPAELDVETVTSLFAEGKIPVVAPITTGPDNQPLNVNADNVASFIAGALGAEKIVFLSNTHGIVTEPKDEDSFASSLSEGEVNDLIARGTISGGMLPKAQACLSAIDSGVRKAHIIDGRISHSILLEIFTDEGIGTQISG